MNYELAKKLKDAGFPQKGFWFYGSNETDTPCLTYETNPYDTCAIQMLGHDDTDIVLKIPRCRKLVLCYAPTLSELIEACEKDYFILMKISGRWHAGHGISPLHGNTESGATPEEAVSNLWLRITSNEGRASK